MSVETAQNPTMNQRLQYPGAMPNFPFPSPAGPSSPPETPTAAAFTFGHPPEAAGIHHHGEPSFPDLLSSRQNGTISPLGHGPHFSYKPSVRPEDFSPRSSTSSSSSATGSPPRSLSSEGENSISVADTETLEIDMRNRNAQPTRRVVSSGNFTVEEVHSSDIEPDSDAEPLEILQPDYYEDASESELSLNHNINLGARSEFHHDAEHQYRDMDPHILASLDLGDENDLERDEFVRQRRMEKRAKRLSCSSFKRDFAQSLGSDTDHEDLKPYDPAYDPDQVGASARRMRRKVGDRNSLLFDDPPKVIPELDEPDSCIEGGDIDGGPPGGGEAYLEAQCVDAELPYFYVGDTSMDMDD